MARSTAAPLHTKPGCPSRVVTLRSASTRGELGTAGLRGWPRRCVCGGATDPWNLHRVMPAKGGILETPEASVALVFAGGEPGGATHVIVVGGSGGRLDHFLANVLLLASPSFADIDIEARLDDTLITVIHRAARLSGAPGDLCSLLAAGGPARGVRTTGLRYPLHGEDLLPGSTRGLSNELAEPIATVSIEHGTLLAVQPDLGGT